MTDIGRLRDLADKAGTSRGPTYDPVGPTRAEFEYMEALHDSAGNLLSEIETLRAENERLAEALRSSIAIADVAADEWDKAPSGMRAGKLLIALSGRLKGYRPDIDEIHSALAAYDQVKVTNG